MINKKQEFKALIIELVKLFRPAIYVEIGARFGYVFNAIAPLVRKAIAVDIIKMDKINKALNVYIYQMTSEQFYPYVKTWEFPIDLLFIDANHTAEAVLADFEALSPFVCPYSGLILLHDTFPVSERLLENDRCGSAWKIAKLIHEQKKDFEIVTLPGPWAGLSIIRKVPKGHGWMDKKEGTYDIK